MSNPERESLAKTLVGDIDFGWVEVNHERIADMITLIVREPAQLIGIDQSSIEIFHVRTEKMAWLDLVAAGTKPFDAILYCQDVKKKDYQVKIVDKPTDTTAKRNQIEAARLMLWLYLYTMMRGQHPSMGQDKDEIAPKFLTTALKFRQSVTEMSKKIASIDISSVPPKWIRIMKIDTFHESIKSRLLLGMPGHRWLNPFKSLDYNGSDEVVARAIKFVKEKLIAGGPYWDLFPSLKSPEVNEKLPSLSKNLMALSRAAFTIQELETLVAVKLIHSVPDDGTLVHVAWKQWPVDITLKSPMREK